MLCSTNTILHLNCKQSDCKQWQHEALKLGQYLSGSFSARCWPGLGLGKPKQVSECSSMRSACTQLYMLYLVSNTADVGGHPASQVLCSFDVSHAPLLGHNLAAAVTEEAERGAGRQQAVPMKRSWPNIVVTGVRAFEEAPFL